MRDWARARRMAFLAALVVPALGLALPFGASAQEGTARIAAGTGAKVNVRAEPEIAAGNVVGRALGGDAVVVVETAERPGHVWYRVRGPGGGYEGWVRGDLIADFDAASVVTVIPPTSLGVSPPPDDDPAPAAAATPNDPSPVARDDWSRYLVEHFPVIRACLNTSSAQPAAVLKAIPLGRGLVDVIVRDAAERRWECIIKENGGTPLRFDPVTWRAATLIRDGDPVFTLTDAPPQAGECFKTEPALDPADGRQIGWLAYRVCP